MLATTLLVLGLIFPVLSWATAIAAAFESRRTGRGVSAVLIPYIGPILLTCWIFTADKPWWTIPIVWLLDLGTVVITIMLPRIIRDFR